MPSLRCLSSVLTQAGGGGLLFRLLVPSRCGEGLALLCPLRCSGSRLFYMERALRCARFQPSGAPQKRGTKSCACSSCLPRPSGSGSQGLDGRTLPGCGAPSVLRVPSPSPRPRRSGGLWLETGGLFAVRQGLRSLGPSLPLSPPPCLLPPAGLGRSAACELSSGLARSLCSANGQQCVLAG